MNLERWIIQKCMNSKWIRRLKLFLIWCKTQNLLDKKNPLPILGNSCNTDKTWEAVKMLKKELGLFWCREKDSIHNTKYLKRLSPIITENQLSESAANELLTSVTGGLTNFLCVAGGILNCLLLNCGAFYQSLVHLLFPWKWLHWK